MKELSKDEMMSINAGGLSASAIAAIAAGLSFIIGIIDGYTRQFKCR